jgi:hypothetical protein
MDSVPSERWLPVVGYEGLYEVSDLGRVRSLRHWTRAGMRGGRVLIQHLDGRGHYLFVGLCRNGRAKSSQVHTLAAAAFIGPCPPGQEVRHGPGGKLDNRAANLSYGTRSENMLDCVRDDTHHRGERQWMAKLTTQDVIGIRRRVSAGETQAALSREFRVASSTIHKIVTRKKWSHLS